jgi:hypothetical protein
MKREESVISVAEREEEEAEAEVEKEEKGGGSKKGWSSERRWDEMEMEVDMDMDDYTNPIRQLFSSIKSIRPTPIRPIGLMFFPLRNYTRRTLRHMI